nr:copia protein [Tanacetum cinerariifolium]
MCQTFQEKFEELKSKNESLIISVQKLTKSRERGKAKLKQRDETISALRKKLRLLEEQSEVFHEIQVASKKVKLAFENADFEFESRVDTFKDKNVLIRVLMMMDSKPSSDDGNKVNEDPSKEIKYNDQEKEDNVNNTNNVNTVNAVGVNEDHELPFDPNMPASEDVGTFDFSNEDEDDDIVTDMNNMDTTIQLHKQDKCQRIWRNMGLLVLFNKEQTIKTFKTACLLVFYHKKNPKRAIGTKWGFRNKKDERGIVIRNKTRLVAQGHTQEEGINYDEVFALVARIEVIRLFLAYASFKDFLVYRMDVKSVFLYEKIKEEVYVCQPLGFEDPYFLDRVYKVEKALYRLHQAPRACRRRKTFPAGFFRQTQICSRSPDLLCHSPPRSTTTTAVTTTAPPLLPSSQSPPPVHPSTPRPHHSHQPPPLPRLPHGSRHLGCHISHADTTTPTPPLQTRRGVFVCGTATTKGGGGVRLGLFYCSRHRGCVWIGAAETDKGAFGCGYSAGAFGLGLSLAVRGVFGIAVNEQNIIFHCDPFWGCYNKDGGGAEPSGEDATIKGRGLETEEEAGVERSTERGSNDTEELVNVLTSLDAASILTSGVQVVSVPPTAKVATVSVPTGSGMVPTASLIFTTASVVTPYARRKGKEKMVESDTPKKKKLQEHIDVQMAREMEEKMAREDQRRSDHIARDAKIARIHAEEELQMLKDGLDRNNETIAKYLQEYEQFAADLSIGEKIDIINELVKYQDHYAKVLKYQAQQSKPLSEKQQIEFYMSIEDFVPMASKEEGERVKRKGLRLEQDSTKKMKTAKDVSKEDLKAMMKLVPVEEVYVEALQHFDREDLTQLWTLVRKTLSIRQATRDKEKELWVELKRLYEPDVEDQLWTHT